MCFLNGIIQILRHVPEYLNELQALRGRSPVHNSLLMLYQKCGSNSPVSALSFREKLATATGTNINSGEQQDIFEALGFVLNLGPTHLFHFQYLTEYRFSVNNEISCCPICKTNPKPLASPPNIFLRLPLPKSWNNPSSPPTTDTFKPVYKKKGSVQHAKSAYLTWKNFGSKTFQNTSSFKYLEWIV